MYLSKLTFNPRSRDARRDMASAYELHRTILRAFADRESGGPGRVLFRVEPVDDDRPPAVIVQSDKMPDWSRLPAEVFARVDGPKLLNLAFRAGQRLRFRLRANPTVKRDGKRLGLLREEDHVRWLLRKARTSGFDILGAEGIPAEAGVTLPATLRLQVVREGAVHSRKSSTDGEVGLMTHVAVRFDGLLRVTDPELFTQSLRGGIGAAKGLGFGLLSLARA